MKLGVVGVGVGVGAAVAVRVGVGVDGEVGSDILARRV